MTTTLMTLTQAAATLPHRRGGKKVSVATLYRWTTTGIRGMRLEYIQVGGTRCVSAEMLSEFFTNLKSLNERGQPIATPSRHTAQQTAANAALVKILGPNAQKS